MSDPSKTVEGWTLNDRPPNLFRRFAFDAYAGTRDFLDRLAELSKETGYYPDVSFGKNYANVTIHARDGKAIGEADREFARRAGAFAGSSSGSGG